MRRLFSNIEKLLILDRDPCASVSEICRKNGIHRRTFYKWRDELNAAVDQERLKKLTQKRHARTAEDQKLLTVVKIKMPHSSSFEVAKHLIEVLLLPVARTCRVTGISRGVWYRWHRIKYVKKMMPELAVHCRILAYRVAKKWNLPPVYITAHIRNFTADYARKEVMRHMIDKLGLSRRMGAEIVGRDLRRVRKSELGV